MERDQSDDVGIIQVVIMIRMRKSWTPSSSSSSSSSSSDILPQKPIAALQLYLIFPGCQKPHSLKLTFCPWKERHPKRKWLIFQPSIFTSKLAVSFREGSDFVYIDFWLVATQIFFGIFTPDPWGRFSPILTCAYFSIRGWFNHQLVKLTPWKRTCPLKIDGWKIQSPLNWSFL